MHILKQGVIMTDKAVFSRRTFLKGSFSLGAMSLLAGSQVYAQTRPDGVVQLEFMYPVGVSGDINRIVTAMIENFNSAHPDVHVQAIYAGNYDNTEQKVITALGVGQPPAAWLPINSSLQTFLGMNALADLTDLAKASDVYPDFYSSFLSMATAEGRLYGLPFQPSTPVLYLNQQACGQAGLSQAPATWDELFDQAKVLTRRNAQGTQQWGLTIGGGWHDWIFECWVRQNGLTPWQADRVLFDAPEAVHALEFWRKMVGAGVMPAASTWEGSANDFMAGRSAMLYHSTGSLTNLRASSSFPVRAALMPKNKVQGACFGGGAIHIAKNQPEKHIQAAWRFAYWMTNTENSAAWSRATGYLAVRKSSWESPAMAQYAHDVPDALIALRQAEFAGPFLQVPAYHKVREYLKSAIDRCLAGELSPEAALKQAADQSNREIARLLRRRA